MRKKKKKKEEKADRDQSETTLLHWLWLKLWKGLCWEDRFPKIWNQLGEGEGGKRRKRRRIGGKRIGQIGSQSASHFCKSLVVQMCTSPQEGNLLFKSRVKKNCALAQEQAGGKILGRRDLALDNQGAVLLDRVTQLCIGDQNKTTQTNSESSSWRFLGC